MHANITAYVTFNSYYNAKIHIHKNPHMSIAFDAKNIISDITL